MLGFVLAEDKTPPPAATQDILGVQVSLRAGVAHLSVDSGKASFWLDQLRCAAQAGTLSSPEARALAGKLSFGCSAVWGRLPRSHLNHFYQLAAGTMVAPALVLAELSWWQRFMLDHKATSVSLSPDLSPRILLYTDASGSGGCGAVLLDGTSSEWFGSNCSAIHPLLLDRKTQINALELFTVLASLRLWRERCSGRRLALLIDNTTALWAVRNGRSTASDLSALSHAIWFALHKLRAHISVFWVPSKLNLADAPSRGRPPSPRKMMMRRPRTCCRRRAQPEPAIGSPR